MKNLNSIILVVVIITAFACSEKKININQKFLKQDWITVNNQNLLYIEDTLLFQTFIETSECFVKFKNIDDSLFFFTKDRREFSFLKNKNVTWKCRILYLDSLCLKLKFEQPKSIGRKIDTISFKRIVIAPRNNFTLENLEFSAHPCFGYCPSFDLKITKDSILYFKGYRFSKHNGLYKHKLDSLEYTRILSKLNIIPRDSFILSPSIPDAPWYQLFVKSSNDSIAIDGTTRELANRKLANFIAYIFLIDNALKFDSVNDYKVPFRFKFNSESFDKNNR